MVTFYRDRIRTTVNILGDVIGCGIVQHMSKGFLAKMDEEQKLKRRASRAQRIQEVMEDVEVEQALLPKTSLDGTHAPVLVMGPAGDTVVTVVR